MASTSYKLIYSSFITGRRINRLSLHAEAWFWRVLALADKHGIVTASAPTLARKTSGLRRVKSSNIAKWLCEMLEVGLLERTNAASFRVVDFERLQPRTVLSGHRAAIPRTTRQDVLAAGLCANCGDNQRLSVDHIQPVSKGGNDARSNLQCLCLPCNIQKSDKWEASSR